MADRLTLSQRSHCMSRIRCKNTKPEILVRKGLHARGFRFRLHNKNLPGSPDVVLPKYGVAIMVNGCFWHGHKGCRYANAPKSNVDFWQSKIARNRHRDEVIVAHLEALGCYVITIWECELRVAEKSVSRIDELVNEICDAGLVKQKRDEQIKVFRQETKLRLQEHLTKQANLERELNALYAIPRAIKKESKIY